MQAWRRYPTLTSRSAGLVTLIMVLSTATPAAAVSPSVQHLQPVSAGGPLATECSLHPHELSTDIAVHPTEPDNIVAVWLQGPQSGIVVGLSKDGGATWAEVTPPGLSACSPDPSGAGVADPRVAFTADGKTALLSALRFTPHLVSVVDEVVINRSRDGGATWSDPVTVEGSSAPLEGINGEAILTTHPTQPLSAYVMWSKKLASDSLPWPGLYFSQSDDGGMSWSAAENVHTPPAGAFPLFSEIRVLPDGRLLAVFLQYGGGKAQLWAMHSDDETHWSEPTKITAIENKKVVDPDSNEPVAFETHTPAYDVAPDGTAYVAWHDVDENAIELASSTDGGASWTPPQTVVTDVARRCADGGSYQAFLPSLAVNDRGTVGVSYYDFRDDCPGDEELTTDVWFTYSRNGKAPWREIHLAGPFDYRATTDPVLRMGVYFGLDGLSDGFAASFIQSEPQAPEPPTDVFFARIVNLKP